MEYLETTCGVHFPPLALGMWVGRDTSILLAEIQSENPIEDRVNTRFILSATLVSSQRLLNSTESPRRIFGEVSR